MKTVLENIIPPGGHHFIDRTGPCEVRIEGYSLQDVAANVLRHRLQNNRPPGNPLQELHDFICGQWPHFCKDINPSPVQHAGLPEPLSRRCAAWMGSWFGTASEDVGVGQQEANRRAAICAQCPKNQNHEHGGCGACTVQVDRLTFIYLRNRSTPSDHLLKCCDVLNSPLRAAVWSDKLPGFSEQQRNELPAQCWRK